MEHVISKDKDSSVGTRLVSPRVMSQRGGIQKLHNKLLPKTGTTVRKVQSSDRLHGNSRLCKG